MSAKSKLDDLERSWERHLTWREGRSSFGRQDPPGKYIDKGRGWSIELRLQELPECVRNAFIADLERIIATELDQRYHIEHGKLALDAIDEAKRTLAEFSKLTNSQEGDEVR